MKKLIAAVLVNTIVATSVYASGIAYAEKQEQEKQLECLALNVYFETHAFTWNTNPFNVLADLYHYLNMDFVDAAPALEVIWDHDQVILEQGLSFYQDLEDQLGAHRWNEWSHMLSTDQAPTAIDAELCPRQHHAELTHRLPDNFGKTFH